MGQNRGKECVSPNIHSWSFNIWISSLRRAEVGFVGFSSVFFMPGRSLAHNRA